MADPIKERAGLLFDPVTTAEFRGGIRRKGREEPLCGKGGAARASPQTNAAAGERRVAGDGGEVPPAKRFAVKPPEAIQTVLPIGT